MATAQLVFPRLRGRALDRERTIALRVPNEGAVIWVLSFVSYIAVASYLVFHLHYMINDAYTRVDNAFNILFSRDPHLGAIGFVWPPLPSFFDMPLVALKGLWPPLATQGFAGSIEAAAFSAGTVVLLNAGLRWAGVVRVMRWIICLIWAVNPMVVIYAAQGMSEAPFIFFFVGSILVFLRWSESRRAVLLPVMGLLAGAAALCRVEALVLAFVMGVCVIVPFWGRGGGWRKVGPEALMYGLPSLVVISLWLGTAAILFHDPLYLIHGNGVHFVPQSSLASPTVVASAAPSIQLTAASDVPGIVKVVTLGEAIQRVFTHVMFIYPAIVALAAVLLGRLVPRSGRVAAICLLMLGVAIPALDVHLLNIGLVGQILRYQISVIPFAFLLGIYVLRSLKSTYPVFSSAVAVALVLVFGLSNVITALDLGDPQLAEEEAPVARALITDKPLEPAGDYGAFLTGPEIVAQLLKLDKDNGTILCDSSTCFALNMVAPDPKLFLITSDRNFEAAAAQPRTHGVEYFLVPQPGGFGAFDRLNELYPSLWQNGARFAKLVGSGRGGGPEQNWRLYRITGPTGIGLQGR